MASAGGSRTHAVRRIHTRPSSLALRRKPANLTGFNEITTHFRMTFCQHITKIVDRSPNNYTKSVPKNVQEIAIIWSRVVYAVDAKL